MLPATIPSKQAHALMKSNLTIIPQPAQPTLACYETATFNTTTCFLGGRNGHATGTADACLLRDSFVQHRPVGGTTGTQPAQPTLNYADGFVQHHDHQWDVTGQPAQPTLACYETASFNKHDLFLDVTGSPAQPTTLLPDRFVQHRDLFWDAGHAAGTADAGLLWGLLLSTTLTCSWDVTGPTGSTDACLLPDCSFNTTTCSWDVTGTQPAMPTLACYGRHPSTTTCSWDVTGATAGYADACLL